MGLLVEEDASLSEIGEGGTTAVSTWLRMAGVIAGAGTMPESVQDALVPFSI